MLGGTSDVLERLCHGATEHAVEHAGIVEAQGAEGVRQCTHHMDVGDVEHLTFPGGEPGGLGGSVALGAVPIATGVSAELFVATLVALRFVAPKGGGTAEGDGAQGAGAARGTRSRHSVPGRRHHTGARCQPLRVAGGASRLRQRQRIEGTRGRTEGLGGDMEGAAGRAQAPMAQQELDPPQIHPCFEEMRREGMTERISTLLIIRR
jgi:hypothetical protein